MFSLVNIMTESWFIRRVGIKRQREVQVGVEGEAERKCTVKR
jgi:hypothetical protein